MLGWHLSTISCEKPENSENVELKFLTSQLPVYQVPSPGLHVVVLYFVVYHSLLGLMVMYIVMDVYCSLCDYVCSSSK